MHALGSLKEQIQQSADLQNAMESLLKQFISAELASENGFLRARAIWLYGQFASFPFADESHLRYVLNSIYSSLSHADLPVRVQSALTLNYLLNHEIAVEFLRPGLEPLLKTYLKVMDDIDFDELVSSLQELVETYEEEIAPYAVALCGKLGEAYLRLLQSKGTGDNEDQETSLTADGLMTAIRRVLKSISGKYKELYPQLEEILEQPLMATLTEHGQSSVEEGIACIAELLYNQDQVSVRMWNFYSIMINLILQDKGILDEFLCQASVPFINFMSKNPEQFKSCSFNGSQTCMDLMFQLIGRIIEIAKAKDDEMEALTAISLTIALLENVPGIDSSLPGVVSFFLKELSSAKTSEYKSMLQQGLCMCFWYSTPITLQCLEQQQCTQSCLNVVLMQIDKLKQDFEVKRYLIGLIALLQSDPSSVPVSITNSYTNIMKGCVYLSRKSIEIRSEDNIKKKAEEADVDVVESAAIYEDEDADDIDIASNDDDDEDYECQEGPDRELYDSKLDQVDEVLLLRDCLGRIQQTSEQFYSYLLQQCIDQNDAQTL